MGRVLTDPALSRYNGSNGQMKFTPPNHIGHVTECAHHRNPGPLLRIREGMGDDRHLHAEQGRGDSRACTRGVPLVVRMRDKSDASRKQLWTGGLDLDATKP
jgi:hypothetical protein